MSGEQNQYLQDREQRNREFQQQAMRGTMETYKLEKQDVGLPRWQQYIVNFLAVVGAAAILYVLANVIF